MNSKLPHILAVFSFGFAAMVSLTSMAQDGGFPPANFQEPSYQELNLNEDKSLIYEAENRSSKTVQRTVPQDTASIKSIKPKANRKPSAEKKEEDPLSFNFLYYIIQKYKISDIVDQ